MDPKKAKSQIAEQLKNAGSVLVTTNSSPSIDEISATIGLSHLLLAMKKHATAVVSSQPPNSLKFLGTEKYLEKTTDRMRDFVLSFDKEKADKFRYKLVDDQVKIFITPYKTTITKDDFNFTQGDFNVDATVIVGARSRQELDQAILQHGRILHEAEVLTINAGKDQKPAIGSVNWVDEEASSICEMLVSISEALGSDLLNKDSAQAFLTGIIESTDMFSSTATSPKVMTMAAQLMAAGADQHKIMEELKVEQPLEPVSMPSDRPATPPTTSDESSKDKNKEDGVSVDLTQMHNKEESKSDAQQNDVEPVAAAPTNLPPPPPKPPTSTQPAAVSPPPSQPQDSGKPRENSGYLRGKGPSDAGANSINSKPTAGDSKVLSHPRPQAPGQQTVSDTADEPHINVHPELPTMHKHERNITPPPPPKPIQTPSEISAQPKAVQPVPATSPNPPPMPVPPPPQTKQQQTTPSGPLPQPMPAPQPTQSQQPSSGASTNSPPASNDVDSARKAVEQAIAGSPPPIPTPRQDMSAIPPQQGGDIVIDHEGNIQGQGPQQGE